MGMFGGNRRVLLVGGEGVVLYVLRGRSGIQREAAISWETPNFEQQLIDALKRENRSRPVRIVFDGADQTYRKEENIPKLSPFDRPRFVKRKLELAFPSYPIRASLEVKPKKNKRQTTDAPSYLFVALPETEHLDTVSRAILESGVPIAGFGLLPLESAGLALALAAALFGADKKPSRWTVLIGQHETGGLRQVVVKDGNLALTRLTPVSDGGVNGAGWVDDVLREFRATLTYISRFGYNTADGLDVVVIGGDVEKQFFNTKDMPLTNFRCVNVTEALRLIDTKAALVDKTNFADSLHAAWIGNKQSLVLPVSVPSIYNIMAPRLAARVASGALVATLMALAFFVFSDYQSYLSMKEEAANKQIQQESMQREYDQEAKVFDTLPMKPDVVAKALNIKATLDKNTINPAPMLSRLRRVLGADVMLEQLEFQHTPDSAIQNTAGVIPTPAFAPDGTPLDRGDVVLSFQFSLPAAIPLEQKVARAEAVQRDIKNAFSSYEVNIVSQFGRVSRSGTFSGGTGSAAPVAGATDNDYAEIEMKGPPL